MNFTETIATDGETSFSSHSDIVLNLAEFEFNRRLLLNVLAYSVMFIIGTIGNVIVFIAAYKQHVSIENHGRNNVHIMVVHLTIADLIVSFVVMPLEIGWRLSVQWYAGNVLCKVLMFLRAFAFYLSSMILVCVSIDRCLAIAQPMAALKKSQTWNRGRAMILTAWLSAALFALPQTQVFRVLKHPQIDFLQCTSMDYFQELMENNTEVSSLLFNVGPETAEKIYNSIFLVFVYMVPLSVIVVTYANIIAKIYRKSREEDDHGHRHRQHHHRRHHQCRAQRHEPVATDVELANHPPPAQTLVSLPALRHTPSTCSLRRSKRAFKFARSQTVALRMSTMHVLAFVGCWTPYLVISLWHILNPQSVESVSAEVQDALFLTAVFNSCIDPLVYGGFYFKALTAKRKSNDNSMRRRRQNSSQRRLANEGEDGRRNRRGRLTGNSIFNLNDAQK